MFWHKKRPPVLKYDDRESTEPDAIIEMNRLLDSEKRFRRSGDTTAALLMGHHQSKIMDEYMRETGQVVTLDTKAYRWKIWRGEFR